MTGKKEAMKQAALFSGDGGREHRRHDRLRFDAEVRYKIVQRRRDPAGEPSDGFRPDGHGINISRSGLSIETGAPLRKGEYLKLELRLPGHDQLIRVLAEVAWSRPREGRHASGIRFLILLNQADDALLRRFVEGSGA